MAIILSYIVLKYGDTHCMEIQVYVRNNKPYTAVTLNNKSNDLFKANSVSIFIINKKLMIHKEKCSV